MDRAKNSARRQTITLWTLYVSLPQVMVRSEYSPDSRELLPISQESLLDDGGLPLDRREKLLLSPVRHDE